jgi:3-hydroxy-9,10-secoandrosta-1,3,5(10)-triene-9,17-dione monooxygenase
LDEDEQAMAASSLAQRRASPSVVPVPEPDLTPRELIARAAALKPLLRAQQAENDERGAYSPELHEAFAKAGLYRTVQPRMFGGYEFDIPTFYRAMLEIAHGHPSAGWCLTLCASHPFLIASHWSERAQRELFGPDGHFAAPHRVPPMGRLTPVEGGYRLTGKWDFCSGIPYSTHLVCGALLPVADGPPEAFCAAVPRDKLNILTTWAATKRWACGRAARTASKSRMSSCLPITSRRCKQCLRGRKICATERRARGFTAIQTKQR